MKLDIEKFRVKPGDKVDLAAISTKADPKADKNAFPGSEESPGVAAGKALG